MIEQKDVTIIIPHLGETEEQEYSLKQCLDSLDETVPNIKKIIAFNGRKMVDMAFDDDIHLRAQGQCKAVNAAVATTNTPWVFVTNDDMVYAPGWFERLVAVPNNISELPKYEIICVSPMLVEPRPGAPTFRTQFFGGAGGDFDKNGWLKFASDWAVPQDLRTGFNLPFLIRRDLWDTVGGYDINYDPWGSNSDSDLLYKIRLAGVQPYQNMNSIVYHFSQTSGTFEPKNDGYRFKNYGYFKEKWGFDRTDIRIWEADFLVPTPEQGRIFQPSWENKYLL